MSVFVTEVKAVLVNQALDAEKKGKREIANEYKASSCKGFIAAQDNDSQKDGRFGLVWLVDECKFWVRPTWQSETSA